jgi:hypothetical protein
MVANGAAIVWNEDMKAVDNTNFLLETLFAAANTHIED